MKLTKKLEEEVMQVYDTWLNSYLTGDIKTYDYYFDDEYRFIGSTGNEEFLNRKDTTNFFEVTADQFAGKTDIRNSNKTIELFGELIFITQLLDAWFLNGNEWAYYGRFRFTSVLRKNDDGWRFIYQHFSAPDLKAAEGETIGYEKISAENLELRQAVKRRTIELNEKNRELQIEAALERVRSKSLAMYKTDDLREVVSVLFEQMQGLSVDMDFASVSIFIFKEGTRNLDQWIQLPEGVVSLHVPYFEHPILSDLFDAKESGADYFAKVYTLEEKNSWAEKGFELTDYKNLPLAFKTSVLEAPGYAMSITLAKNSGICIPSFIGAFPSAGDVNILKRAGKVFEQAYIRFLDLQKAEAQAREAKIEAALERVRARTMAMQKSSELGDVATVLFSQLNLLVENLWTCGFVLCERDRAEDEWWLSDKNGFIPAFYLPNVGDVTHANIYNAWKNDATYHTEQLEGEALQEHYDWLMSMPVARKIFDDMLAAGFKLPNWQKLHCAYFKTGYLVIITQVPCAEEEIFKRFAQVFDLTYTRFLDLQKAEAQAREAKIEAALEKIRSRTMAMQHSDELQYAAILLFQQVQSLGIKTGSCGFFIWMEDEKTAMVWNSSQEGGLQIPFKLPHTEIPHYKRVYEAAKKGDEFHVEEVAGEALEKQFNYLRKLDGIKEIIKKYEDAGFALPSLIIYHDVFFKQGYLSFHTHEPAVDAHDIFKRFGKVFEQTYTRFLDLQKAEAQAREAKIETALERTRTQSMLMQHSDEIKSISNVFHQQLLLLGIPSEFSYVWLPDESKNEHQFWASWAEDNVSSFKSKQVSYPLDKSEPYTAACYAAWSTPKLVNEAFISPAEVTGFFEVWQELLAGAKNLKANFFPDGIFYSEAYMRYGCFGINIRRQLIDEEKQVLKRFAVEFERAYTRFLDLQKAEAQAREAQIEAALERVRSKTMGMQRSEQLGETASILFKQFDDLGINVWSSGFQIWKDDNISTTAWMSSAGGEVQSTGIRLPHTEDPYFINIYNARNTPDRLFVMESKGKELEETYRYMFNIPDWKKAFGDIEDAGFPIPKYQITHCAYFTHGYLMLITHESYPEYWDIFKRFATVFEQTYTRFLDLQKAEAQAREAQIELALERVRARTMAMQHSEELLEVATVLFQQVKGLGVPQWNCGFNIWEPGDEAFTYYPGSPDGVISPSPCKIPLHEHPVFRRFDESRTKGIDLLVYEKKGEEQKDHYQYMLSLPGVGDLLQSMLDAGFELPTFQIDHLANFAYGNLIFITYEHFPEMHIVFKRFAKVFEQTYTRFLDLQKAEAQTREAQIEAALEKVRSRSLAMHKSDELSEVIVEVQRKFQELDISMESRVAVVVVFDKNSRNFNQWVASPDFSNIYISTPYFRNPILDDFWTAKEAGDDFYSNAYSLDVKNSYFKYFFENSNYENVAGLEEQKKWLFEQAFYAYSPAFEKNSSIGIADFSGKALTKREIEIIKRFAKVFEQAYVRFLDLQKAEAQAREAKIEAALERVRSRSLAMHQSSELNEVVSVLFENLKVLQIPATAIGIGVSIEGSKDLNSFVCGENQDGLVITNYRFPYFDNIISKDLTKVLEEQLDFFVGHYSKEEKNSFYGYIIENTPEFRKLPEDIKQMIFESPSYTISSVGVKNAVFSLNDFDGKTLTEKEVDIIKRFARTFEQAFTRFLDLQKAEKQTREAQINLAVERVRARALAMFKSEEILEVVIKLKEELIGLDIPGVAAAAILLKEKNGMFRSWDLTSLELNGESMHTPLDVPFDMEKTHPDFYLRKVWEKGTNYTVVVQDTKSLQITCDWLRENNKVKEAEEAEQFIKDSGLQRGYHPTVPLNNGRMILDLLAPPADEIESILTKMGGAFDLAYKRFEDLKNSEEQLREARIEAALERVRSRSMAMHKSEELRSVVDTVYGEMQSLQVNFHVVGIQLLIDNSKDLHLWLSTSDGLYDDIIHWPFTDIPVFHEIYKAHTTGEMLKYTMSETTTREFFEQYFKVEGVPQERKMALQNVKVIDIAGAYQKFTGVFLMRYSEGFYSPYEKDIITRFSKVFEQTYTRFLDLQKAEAQVREAQIEAALERVRSRTMGMHTSEEMKDLVSLVIKQLIGLGFKLDLANFNYHGSPKEWLLWMATPDFTYPELLRIPAIRHPLFERPLEAYKQGQDFMSDILTAEEFKSAYAHFYESSKLNQWDDPQRKNYVAKGIGMARSVVFMKSITLTISNFQAIPYSDAQNHILKRFANAFEQAYIRFLDIQKAEAQAREAKIEAALEKVRSRSLAMHKAEELIEVASVLRTEMGLLGVEELETSSIYILSDENANTECWYVIKDIREINGKLVTDHMTLNLKETWVGRAMISFYHSGEKQNSILMQGENRKEWINYCATKSTLLQGYYGGEIPERTYHLLKFSNGYMGAASPGSISTESWNLLQRATSVFSFAYTRFLDLQKAEAQALKAEQDLIAIKEAKQKAEDALTELQAAQKQLIQSEKMASLGELTAGIAHEIQNPLNFVNNFSEVSSELLDEMQDEINKGNLEDAKEILADVLQNLEKINHHGKRADAIVKGMLQHSQSSTGKKELTDINALCDEYLRLSYHGLRAKDKSFNATMDTGFDASIGKINVIPQDIGRVVLNIINNAFYAVNERSKLGEEGYEPTVTITTLSANTPTSQHANILSITISDNGLGIPDNIKEKIFQPFFTTKPTGQGTGLGLSLSYDIVKTHGGTIKVESQEREGTQFIITLPIV